ncbi:hypothetical protein ACJQWK_08773 [Exserohilum turcicum]|uniref:Carbohydrate esterase family 3 protein n=1 Tax=Exserohilum turcicum (strain 28A) TaxID=671987 RepID=R0ISH9_EXST2|nr:carbohydrate esterase family 3 protein [Exserohilum turcica Et28A]EOA87591.1 carbohydrate esterase family 3 protein [Exserohilum turcica Et28A]
MVKFAALALGLLSIATQVCAQNTVKVMPFGASIVSRCWRADLQTQLRAAGVTNFDFVGSQTGKCAGTNIDQDHEGHPGSLATDYAKNGNLTVWLDKNTPDVVLMLVGTNDVLIGKKPVSDILAAYDTLIAQMRAKNAKMQIVFSNLLPLDPARFPAAAVQGIVDLNNALKTYVPGKSNLESPVVLVDNFAGFDAVKDTDDGEHPNTVTGIQKMASRFLDPTSDAIVAASTASEASVVGDILGRGFHKRRLLQLQQQQQQQQ